jgi:hypothetical protein
MCCAALAGGRLDIHRTDLPARSVQTGLLARVGTQEVPSVLFWKQKDKGALIMLLVGP